MKHVWMRCAQLGSTLRSLLLSVPLFCLGGIQVKRALRILTPAPVTLKRTQLWCAATLRSANYHRYRTVAQHALLLSVSRHTCY